MNLRKFGLGLLDATVKIVFVIIVVMLIMRYSKLAYNYGYHIFNQTAVSSGTGRTVTFKVGQGDSVSTIADNLSSVGLITDRTLFRLQERFSEYHGKEKPGTYELSTAMTPDEMLAIMSGGSETEEGGSDAESGEDSSGG
ncbi:MAG: endolytic transglycosylase MltG [Butyrivibrio sp.]|nr:endolytic transglycosylase MltG [Butyrivibrio sp.]